jgi:sugar phosphate isomerase/epimerase
MTSRREFLAAATAAGGALAVPRAVTAGAAPVAGAVPAAKPTVSVFSKHLQHLDYRALADTVAEAGYDGLDLTVRAGGHVLPERVAADLPKAVEAARAAGLSVPMITTTITSTRDAHAEAILHTAGDLGVGDYRLGWIPYDAARGIEGTLEALTAPLADLARLNERCRIRGGYQNHAGTNVGGAVWDLWLLLRDVGSPWLGCQYDIRHAVIEGGSSWTNGLRLIAPFVHTVDVKDGHWAKTDKGWRPVTVPLGEGAVDLVAFFRLLGELRVSAPISMHFEYPFPETGTPAERRRAAVALMRRDGERLRAAMAEAAAKAGA